MAESKSDPATAPTPPLAASVVYAVHHAIIAMALRKAGGLSHQRANDLATAVVAELGPLGWLKAPTV